MEACNAGFWDLRNGELDGCEYACGLTLGGNEACDRIDNDCDGIVDDGYDLQTDVEHCGTCETRCAFDNAEASCQAGACRLGACLGGFLNQNGDAADGCEYGCSPSNGGVERCDGVDNDCDRQVDETFDLTTDVNNCGACGAVCRFADAAASCVARSCRMGACDPGHVDLNGLSEDGCEYACSVANGGIELCNRRDDDCDGTIDETFDLSVDLANCGACGVACAYDFGVPVCDRGTCELAACTANHWDLDGLPGNGCEYACAPTNGGVEVCDGIDNDCDGGGRRGLRSRHRRCPLRRLRKPVRSAVRHPCVRRRRLHHRHLRRRARRSERPARRRLRVCVYAQQRRQRDLRHDRQRLRRRGR
jgi:Notch-like protein